jgi:hypothetical protein
VGSEPSVTRPVAKTGWLDLSLPIPSCRLCGGGNCKAGVFAHGNLAWISADSDLRKILSCGKPYRDADHVLSA